MARRPIGTPAPLGSGWPARRAWVTIFIASTATGLVGCTAGRTATPPNARPVAKIRRVAINCEVDIRLTPVFSHSFRHSFISSLQSNGVEVVVTPAESSASDPATHDADPTEKLAIDGLMHITVDPIYRTRADGAKAVVGTDFKASLIDPATWTQTWQTTGKVDYIKLFGPAYIATPGIKKEFAWNTTAAIVRKFIKEVNGQKPARIYTVTEARQSHGQRID